jgi:hypothetical protein
MEQERCTTGSEDDNAVMKIDFLNPSSLEFRLDSYMRLNLYNKTAREIMEDADLKLMFPLTHRTGYLEIFNGEEEIGVIRNLKDLSSKNQKVIEEVLEQRYFVPEITQIRKVIERYRLVYWEVLTDRGEMNFYTRTRHDIVVKENQVFIRDIDSNRYLIRDITRLSPQSRKELNPQI